MKYRLIFFISFFITSSMAYALDSNDIGEYAVVHVDGHITNKVFRVTRNNSGWQLEDRKQDGSWDNVTCEKNCILSESKEKEVEYFMGGKAPDRMSASCVHNQAFAFCSVIKTGDHLRKYVFVALVQNPPITIRLVRLNHEIRNG